MAMGRTYLLGRGMHVVYAATPYVLFTTPTHYSLLTTHHSPLTTHHSPPTKVRGLRADPLSRRAAQPRPRR
eukprot:scaffold58236_cov45-Phaeocystis_antarctica.AAC.1